ncbi:hypothetical protein DERP_002200 [Dermatophagoides pteronyssinus]|uniref:Uncharacterized protein n=1 Tax=Dermatophagoides pteronyssinus TaxID=6956 RepID=A0ABQ8JH18_DERPT|nr:hypothetical protein DERP_002200 [Dermatophagoides pteronyssinus]
MKKYRLKYHKKNPTPKQTNKQTKNHNVKIYRKKRIALYYCEKKARDHCRRRRLCRNQHHWKKTRTTNTDIVPNI